MGSGVVVGIGTFFPTHRRIQGLEGADDRNGTTAGRFETVAGFCGDEVFAAGQPGCMSISMFSPTLPSLALPSSSYPSLLLAV